MSDDRQPKRSHEEAGRGVGPDQTVRLPRAPDWVIRLLLEVTTSLTATLDLDDVLGEMLTRTVRLADAAAGTIILVDHEGCAMRKIAVRGGLPYEVAEEVVSKVLGCGLAHWVYVNRRTACVPDVGSDERWLQIAGDWYTPRSAVCLPVMRHGRVLGTLTLTHVRLDHFPPPMVELLEAIAAQAAIAIENARLFGEVQRLAITDGLTGLYNRRHLLQMAEAELTRHLPISVVLADIDLFKQVNDTRGHMVGDEVLCGVVERLRAVLEARQCGFLGRYGGEEFAAILPGCPLAKAREHAEELRRAVCQSPIETSGGALTATVSFGVAEAPADAAELRELLRRADERLYEAKKAGRNCVR